MYKLENYNLIMNEILKFTIKCIILSITIIVTVNYLLPKIPETGKNKMLAASFIQNPYILWKLSEINEIRGNTGAAIFYMESAIGLIEMNCGSEKIIFKYQQRLNNLKIKN